jgi:hypothetical protein
VFEAIHAGEVFAAQAELGTGVPTAASGSLIDGWPERTETGLDPPFHTTPPTTFVNRPVCVTNRPEPFPPFTTKAELPPL